ncbi:MAG: hypothetical protein C6P37_16645 [Caldibacillus debilis]|uniref:Uncharacterized protein n=1 Tax=Caldibacillus debilis TaxID=301148 RepID=A0A3E0JUN9_9BACI|nr:MAG: hypothetical protein C6P37_16645 [Caldibacillus debilis]
MNATVLSGGKRGREGRCLPPFSGAFCKDTSGVFRQVFLWKSGEISGVPSSNQQDPACPSAQTRPARGR